MIPVCLINLPRDTARRRRMESHLRERGIGHALFCGVDGRALSDDEAAPHLASFRKGYGRDMTRGELGCALSHMQLFQRIAAGPDPFVCIMEDDIEVSTAVLPFLDEATLRSLPPFDVLRLFSFPMRRTRAAWTVATVHDRSVVVPLRSGWGTHAQILTREGASKLVNWPITAPVDGIYHDHPPPGLRIMEVRPSLIGRLVYDSNTKPGLVKPATHDYWGKTRAEIHRVKRVLLTRTHFMRTWGLRGIIGLIRARYRPPAGERNVRLARLGR